MVILEHFIKLLDYSLHTDNYKTKKGNLLPHFNGWIFNTENEISIVIVFVPSEQFST